MAIDRWTEYQLLAVIKLYCRTAFGRMHSKNPDIIQLSQEIGRTSNAVALKMANFASLDPTIDRKGMPNVSALDRSVWDKFMQNIDLHVDDSDISKNGFSEVPQSSYEYIQGRKGLDVEQVGKVRYGQSFFREMILASYDGRCALSEISEPELLVASHIAPWAADKERRLDPRNGLCLNSLLDRAFDRGLIAFSDDMGLLYSSDLDKVSTDKIRKMSAAALRMPSKFHPDPVLLRAHRERANRIYVQ